MSKKNKQAQNKAVQEIQPRYPLKETLCGAAVLCLAGAVVYANSFKGQFIFDDLGYTNFFKSNSIRNFLMAPENRARLVVSLSLAANYALSGLEVWSYHAFNLMVHLLAGLTLFGILRHTFQSGSLRERFGRHSAWLALAVALLWLLHPLQTEAVTYIWQRCESLAGLFYLLTVYFFIRGAEAQEPSPGAGNEHAATRSFVRSCCWYALALLACVAGMGCKATLITAPVMVFAYDRVFLAQKAVVTFRKRWGLYLALAASWLVLAAFLLAAPPNNQISFSLQVRSPIVYAQTQLGVILHYLSLSLWPAGLCLDYLWPAATQWGEILPSALVVGILLAATLWAWFRRPALSFPGVWFFVILAPTSSFLPLLQDLAAERRMYLPLASVLVLAVVSIYLLGAARLRRMPVPEKRRETLGKRTAIVSLAAAAVLLGVLTFLRNTDYYDPVAMWRLVAGQRPNNCRAFNNLGEALNNQGKVEEALQCFKQAVEINKTYAAGWANRGAALWKVGRGDEALANLNEALKLNPTDKQAFSNRSVVRLEKGDRDGALSDAEKALALDPLYPEAYSNRGTARQSKGEYDLAISDFNRAIELNPFYAEAFCNRGVTKGEKGDYEGSIADCDLALAIKPDYGGAFFNRGISRYFDLMRRKKTDYGEALTDFEHAIACDHNHWQAWLYKGLALIKQGQETEAQACFNESVKINPGLQNSLPSQIGQARSERQALLEKGKN
jgi:tetratricopeptide (TPR) repeat protein